MRMFSGRRILCLGLSLLVFSLGAATRPYEIVEAGRTADEVAPVLPLASADGWRAVSTNAEAKVFSATDRPLFADGSLRLDYRSRAKRPCLRLELLAPLSVGAFDTFSVWVYGNNFYGRLEKAGDTPTSTLRACFADVAGKPFDFIVGHIRHRQWSKFQCKVPKDLRACAASGKCRFLGFALECWGPNETVRRLDFTSVCIYREELKPLAFVPRARRGVQVFPEAPQGANTGTGRLPFPTVETTIVPPVAKKDSDLEFRFPTKPGVWDDLAFRLKGGPWIPLAQGGGVWPRTAAAAARSTFRRIGNSVVADVSVPGGAVEELRFGAVASGPETKRIVVPYLHYGRYKREEAPQILVCSPSGSPRFVSAMFDWTQSNGSEPFAGRENGPVFAANGGIRYVPKTDGARNDVYERFVWTVAPKFEEALPFIPNPKSPWKHVTGRGCWVADPAKPGRRENDELWRKMTRRGIRRMIVTDHEAAWRDEDESFTFKTNCAAGKGGDAGQYRWARHMIDELGFRYGPYNNFTDLAPVNQHWHSDHALRKADGNFLESWSRCFSPKPLYGLEMCEKLTPVIQNKFGFNTAYCDVHTAVPPWTRTDYDARVPGAATFAQTFYAYGEILLMQRRIWGGPVWSEGYSHWMYAGLVDGNYGQDRIYELCKNPWLVDFDLRRLHPLECDHGMGYADMLFGYDDGAVPKDRWEILNRWLPLTLAFGHSAFLLPQHRTYAYYMTLAIASRYTQENAKDIRYGEADGRLLDTSAALVSGAYARNCVAVTYDGGTFVAVNGNRDGAHFKVPRKIHEIDLPPWGFFATGGDVLVYSGVRGGNRYDFCRGGADAGYVYLNGRGKPMSCAGGATDGEVVRLREKGGTEEVIPLEGVTQLALPYAAKRIVGLTGAESKETGEVAFTVDARGWTHLTLAKEAFSYRVTLPDGYVEPSVEAYERELTEKASVTPAAAVPAVLTSRRLAWAHYVGWTIPTEVSLPPADHYEFPTHERGEEAFRDEIRRALDMGLDGFFVDVTILRKWRPGFYFNVEALLKAAEGTPFMVAPCLDVKTDVSNQVDHIVWMMKRFGNHPNYPRVGGKYVLATYTYHEWKPQEWKEMLDGCAKAGCPLYLVGNVKPSCGVLTAKRLEQYRDVFDCCYSFAYTGRERLSVEDENRGVADWCAANGKLFMPCIHPGYIGAWLKGHNALYIPFEGHGKFLRDFASARAAGKWLHFTSWNDNVETTLQPMASTPGNRQLIRAATDTFKRLPPSAEKIDVSFAYHREELPGTLVRIEAVRLPAREEGTATVAGRLVGADGKTVVALPAKRLSRAWDRIEWLVPSADLLRHPELTPVFTLKTDTSSRQGTFPALAFRTPWIENQITVHATFESLADVKGNLFVGRRPGGIRASLSFAAPSAVRRAILYRNDRPAGQFRAVPQANGFSGLPLLLRGECRFELTVPGGRIVAATRRGQKKGYDGFDWNEREVVCRPRALYYDTISAWVEGTPETEVVFTSDVGGERRFKLGELAKTRRLKLRNGALTLQTFPDCTLREVPVLDRTEGTFSLDLFDRAPYSGDAFYVRFELADGRVAETARVRPFGRQMPPVERPILETAVTLETYPGMEGLPHVEPMVAYREYLTAEEGMPVRGTKRLMRPVADQALRREYWPLEEDGRSAVSDRWAFADKATFGVGPEGRRGLCLDGGEKGAVKLPVLMWPQDTAVVELDIAPTCLREGEIIRRVGYGTGFTLRMLADGTLEATWSGVGKGGVWDVKCAKSVSFKSAVGLKTGRWTHIRLSYDLDMLAMTFDGKEVGRTPCEPFRAYGPNTVYLGGRGFNGYLAHLKIRPLENQDCLRHDHEL